MRKCGLPLNGATHARVKRNLVVVTTRERPSARASKRTIVWSLTVRSYREEIRELYGGLLSTDLKMIYKSNT